MDEMITQKSLGVQFTRGYLIVALDYEFDNESLAGLQLSILEQVTRRSARGVILDVSSISVMDDVAARQLSATGRMTSLLGAPAVLVGIKAEVAATLVDLGVSPDALAIAVDLDDAFNLLERVAVPSRRSWIDV